jgi:hypothetical protein
MYSSSMKEILTPQNFEIAQQLVQQLAPFISLFPLAVRVVLGDNAKVVDITKSVDGIKREGSPRIDEDGSVFVPSGGEAVVKIQLY